MFRNVCLLECRSLQRRPRFRFPSSTAANDAAATATNADYAVVVTTATTRTIPDQLRHDHLKNNHNCNRKNIINIRSYHVKTTKGIIAFGHHHHYGTVNYSFQQRLAFATASQEQQETPDYTMASSSDVATTVLAYSSSNNDDHNKVENEVEEEEEDFGTILVSPEMYEPLQSLNDDDAIANHDEEIDIATALQFHNNNININNNIPISRSSPSSKQRQNNQLPSYSETQIWKTWTHQVLTTCHPSNDGSTPQLTATTTSISHLALLLQWWTRQRPFTNEAAQITWQLLDLVLTQYNNHNNHSKDDDDSYESASMDEDDASRKLVIQNLINMVLDHWRLSANAVPSVSVPYTAYEVCQRLLDPSTDGIVNIRTYAILVSAISRQNFDVLPPQRRGPLSPLALAIKVLQYYMEHRPQLDQDTHEQEKRSLLVLWNSILTVIAKQGVGPHVGEKAEMMLREMEKDLQSAQLVPDPISYSCVLEAWAVAAKHNNLRAGTNAERLLQETIRVCGNIQVTIPQQDGSGSLVMDEIRKPILTQADEVNKIRVAYHKALSTCYLHVFRAYCDSGTSNGADRANDLLQELKSTYLSSLLTKRHGDDAAIKRTNSSNSNDSTKNTVSIRDHVVRPTRHFFSAVMAGYADRGKPNEAERLLFELQDLYDSSRRHDADINLYPTIATFNSVLDAYARLGTPTSAERAQFLLEQLHDQAMKSDTSSSSSTYGQSRYNMLSRPDTTSVNTCIHAWAQSGAVDAVERAEELLLKASQWPYVSPDPYSYTSVMKALANSNRSDAAPRCETILQHMWEQYERKGTRSSSKPNDVTYATAIYCWSTSTNNLDAPIRAEALFKDMRKRYADGDHSLKPTLSVYISLILTWAQCSRPEGDVRAQLYFDLLRGQYLAGDDSLRPNDKVYRALIESKKVRNDGEGAEMTLNHMYDDYLTHGNTGAKPNRYIYHGVMSAWVNSKHPNASQRIEAIIHRMQQEYKVRKWDCKPNAITYTILLNCLAKIGTKDSASRAEKVLRHMYELSSADETLKPCRYSCTAVMQAWANTVGVYDAPLRAQAIFDDMIRLAEKGDHGIRPNSFTYNMLLTTWARSLHSDAAERSLSTLQEMEHWHEVDPKNFDAPNHFHYTAVTSAFANIGDVDQVEKLLERMSNRRIKPHASTINSILKAYSRSPSLDSVERAEKVLRTMEYQYSVTPDRVSYTTFILCIQRCRRPDSYTWAKSVVNEMIQLTLDKYAGSKSPVAPTSATFGILVAALRECTDPSVDRIVELDQIASLMQLMGVEADPTVQKDMIKIRLASSSMDRQNGNIDQT